MTKKFICVLFTLASLCAYAQDGYVKIQGTRLSLKPPAGFEPISGFTGLKKGETSMIQVFDLGGGDYNATSKSFTKEEFEKKEMKVLSFTETKISGFPARIVHAAASEEARMYSVMFGDATFSVMMMGMYPATESELETEMKEALLSARYNKDEVIDPFASVNFKLDDSKSKLKFVKSAANMFIYTIGGAEKAKDGPMVIVVSVPLEGEAAKPKDLAEQMVAGLKNKGFGGLKATEKEDLKVNGCDGYSMKLQAKKDDKEATILIQSFVKNDTAVIIQGICQGKPEDDIAEIKALSSTLQIK
jgi:hypothetical protein